jgi:hypothetical protein
MGKRTFSAKWLIRPGLDTKSTAIYIQVIGNVRRGELWILVQARTVSNNGSPEEVLNALFL